jgi:hypothetical protein
LARGLEFSPGIGRSANCRHAGDVKITNFAQLPDPASEEPQDD